MKKTLMIAIMFTMITAMLSGCGCEKTNTSTTKSTTDEATTHVEVVTEVTTDEQGNTYYEETTENVADSTVQTANDKKKAERDATSPTAAVKNDTSKAESKTTSNANNSSSSSKSNSGSTNSNSGNTNNSASSSQSSTADPHAGKTWHEAVYKTVNHPAETKQVKVVDQEAYSYEEPVYELKRIHKCKDCGIDLLQLSDDERLAHAKNHVLNEGGDGGWYSTTEQVKVGTRTVTVPEESHMETVVVKESWTEQVLVKEAGWY